MTNVIQVCSNFVEEEWGKAAILMHQPRASQQPGRPLW
jgi:hypothetical protein